MDSPPKFHIRLSTEQLLRHRHRMCNSSNTQHSGQAPEVHALGVTGGTNNRQLPRYMRGSCWVSSSAKAMGPRPAAWILDWLVWRCLAGCWLWLWNVEPIWLRN
jgi:hypothetical protein